MADAIGVGRRACRREGWAMEVAAGQQDRHCKYRVAMMGEPKHLIASAGASWAEKTRIPLTANPRSGSYVYSNCGNTRARLHFLSTSPRSLGLALHVTATPARIITQPPVCTAPWYQGARH